MGKFISILQESHEFHREFDDGDELSRFMITIQQKFNSNHPLHDNFKQTIDEFFHYKWKMDKNFAFNEPDDIRIFEELPEEVQIRLFRDYLFKDFL